MSPLRVFVIDPDDSRAARLAAVAHGLGHEVERFTHGERAIDGFVQKPADALLVQYVLPGRDGVATVEAIRWAPGGRDVRVVLLADDEPVTAPLQMLALRVDARATLVGAYDDHAVERALADLERDWDDDGTLALGDDSYADHLHEARRSRPAPLPEAARPPHAEWLDAATVIAGAVRVETVEHFGDETLRGEDAAVARAIGIGASPPIPDDRPIATFDDVTTTEPGEGVQSAATVSQRPLDASDARAILGISGGKIVGRGVTAARPMVGARFAAPSPTSSFRAPASSSATRLPSSAHATGSVTPILVASPPEPTPERPLERAPAPHAFADPPRAAPAAPLPFDDGYVPEPPPRTPSAVRRAEISTRQITVPREAPPEAPIAPLPALPRAPADPHTVDEGRFVAARAKETRGEWSGGFASTPFPALLRRIAEARATGGLVCTAAPTRPGDPRGARPTVDGEPPTKVVYFRAGVPVLIRSNVVDECLGQLLLRKKRIGIAALEASIRRMRERGGLQGQALVEMGVLTPVELGELLAEQVRQKLFDLFGWRRGEYRFASDMAAPRDGVDLEMALPDMVYEGVCAAMPATLLLDIMTPRLERFVVPDPVRLARFARVRVARDLRDVLEAIDGATKLRDVLRMGPRPGAIAQLLYALESLGAVSYELAPEKRTVQLAPLSLEQPIPEPGPTDEGWDDETSERPPQLRPAPSPAVVIAPVLDVARRAGAPTSADLDGIPSASDSSLRALDSHSDAQAMVTGPRAAQGERDRALDAHVDRMFEAERCFRRGNRSLARAEHREALAAFERAVELCPEEGEFVAYLGWARYCVGPASPEVEEAALGALVRATRLAPDLHLTHLLHARVLEHARCLDEAREAYREVLALEPGMEEAREAIARLGGSRR